MNRHSYRANTLTGQRSCQPDHSHRSTPYLELWVEQVQEGHRPLAAVGQALLLRNLWSGDWIPDHKQVSIWISIDVRESVAMGRLAQNRSGRVVAPHSHLRSSTRSSATWIRSSCWMLATCWMET